MAKLSKKEKKFKCCCVTITSLRWMETYTWKVPSQEQLPIELDLKEVTALSAWHRQQPALLTPLILGPGCCTDHHWGYQSRNGVHMVHASFCNTTGVLTAACPLPLPPPPAPWKLPSGPTQFHLDQGQVSPLRISTPLSVQVPQSLLKRLRRIQDS